MINFPDAPTINQVVASPNGLEWIWNGSAWLLVGVGLGGGGSSGGGCTADSIPPPNPDVGDMWYDTTSGRTYIWYDNTWSEMTGVPSSISAMDLLGTTLAPNVVNASLRNVTSTGALTLSGGAGAITQVLAPGAAGALVLQAASESLIYIDSTGIYLQPNAGDRVYLGGRSGYLPLSIQSAIPSGTYNVPSSSSDSDIPGVTLTYPSLKLGDVLVVSSQIDCSSGSTAQGVELRIGLSINGANAFYSYWNPRVAGVRQTMPLITGYNIPADGAYTVKLVVLSSAVANSYTVLHGYGTRMEVQLWGIR